MHQNYVLSQPQHQKYISRRPEEQTFIPNILHHFHTPLSLQPSGNQINLTRLTLNHQTSTPKPRALEMPPSPLHDAPDAPVAERLVRAEGALFHGTLQLALEALDQPVDLEVHTCVDEAVEMPAGVLEGQRVGVGEI